MIEYDLEDFLEEVKYQMTLWDYLEEDMIFEWEDKAREWVDRHANSRIIKKGKDDITILVKDEDMFEEMARLYYRAKRDQTEEEYWKTFKLV